MKRIILSAALLILCMAGAYAQTAEQQTKQFPPIEKKELDLKYLGSDSSSVLERIKKNGVTSRYLQKPVEADINQKKTKKLESEMPIMQPDSSMQFYILAVVPDSTILFHIRVKKPE
ncbi:hypothetical protein H7F15_19270 [Pontibacter sp. Tf4]|uniref:hypothetical protein n=1 Tax=Pontibacter sp. Tf4 TaxID=2761620 RepID=UPI001623E269|nr:hypothetical protein [Pontibacter sp. Tf4]MBB6613184.1 hypothetical protein [Pontibacter sp. Tf4]